MIKINLLPKTLNQKAVLRNTAILFGAVLLVLVGAGVGYSFKLQGDVDKEDALATETEAYEQRVKAIQDQTAQLIASVAPMQAKLDFINNVLKYNLEFPKLYEQVARWTYGKAVLDAVQCDGATVTLQGRVKTIDDLGRYLLNMYGATDIYTEVLITQATGFGSKSGDNSGPSPETMGSEISGSHATQAGIEAISGSVAKRSAESMWISFTALCKLKTPIVAPTFAAAAGAPPGGGPAPLPAATSRSEPMPTNGRPTGGNSRGPNIERQTGGM